MLDIIQVITRERQYVNGGRAEADIVLWSVNYQHTGVSRTR